MSESTKPFYLETKDDFTQLESETSVIPPRLIEGYRGLEDDASSAFLEDFGQFLSEDQQRYFANRQILFTDHQTANYFINEWAENVESIEPREAEIDGVVYLSYAVGAPAEAQQQTDHISGSTIHQNRAGRVVVHPLAEDEVVPVSGEWLISESAFFERVDKLGLIGINETVPFIYSTELAQTTIHEKVHGVQDWRLPLPILEAAAHYYERSVAHIHDWKVRTMAEPMEALADFYGSCIDELGDDVHRLLFGTLDEQRRGPLLTALKVRFSNEQIKRLSQSDNPDQRVHWRVVPVDEIDQQVA